MYFIQTPAIGLLREAPFLRSGVAVLERCLTFLVFLLADVQPNKTLKFCIFINEKYSYVATSLEDREVLMPLHKALVRP